MIFLQNCFPLKICDKKGVFSGAFNGKQKLAVPLSKFRVERLRTLQIPYKILFSEKANFILAPMPERINFRNATNAVFDGKRKILTGNNLKQLKAGPFQQYVNVECLNFGQL